MKRIFATAIVLIFTLFLLNSLALAEEAEKAKAETKVEVYKITKESDREIGEEQENEENEEMEEDDDDDMAVRELLGIVRRQNEQIQQLREEIMKLRRLIEERLQPQMRREGEQPRRLEREQSMNIDSEIKMLEDKISRDPHNFEARMRLAHLYDERGRIDAAIAQYKMAAKLRPDYEEPNRAIERIKARLRESQPEGEFNVGEVISANREYVTIKTLDGGKTVAFKVPGEDMAERAKSLGMGARVRIFWKGIEGQKVIRRIELIEREEAKPMQDFNMGNVIESGSEYITIKTLEGETETFMVPRVKKDNGEWVLNEDFADIAKSLDKGAKVKIFWKKVEGKKIITRIER